MTRLHKVKALDLSLSTSTRECSQLLEGGGFPGIQSRRNSILSAQGYETLMSNRSEAELARMIRANLGRTMSRSCSVLPTAKGQI